MTSREKLMNNLGIQDGINMKALKSNSVSMRNKIGERNIFQYRGKYAVEFTIAGKHERAIFSTLEEAIAYRDDKKKKILENF